MAYGWLFATAGRFVQIGFLAEFDGFLAIILADTGLFCAGNALLHGGDEGLFCVILDLRNKIFSNVLAGKSLAIDRALRQTTT